MIYLIVGSIEGNGKRGRKRPAFADEGMKER